MYMDKKIACSWHRCVETYSNAVSKCKIFIVCLSTLWWVFVYQLYRTIYLDYITQFVFIFKNMYLYSVISNSSLPIILSSNSTNVKDQNLLTGPIFHNNKNDVLCLYPYWNLVTKSSIWSKQRKWRLDGFRASRKIWVDSNTKLLYAGSF